MFPMHESENREIEWEKLVVTDNRGRCRIAGEMDGGLFAPVVSASESIPVMAYSSRQSDLTVSGQSSS